MAIIQQGRFTQGATAANKTLEIRSDFDYMLVINETKAIAAGNGDGVKYEFFNGMTNGRGLVYNKLAADDSITLEQIAASAGFNLKDTGTDALLGAAVEITAGTDATRPVYTVDSSAGLVAGSIVRLSSMTANLNMGGYDFAVDNIDVGGTNFRIAATLATAPGGAATAGNYRVVNFDPEYYPPYRYIVNVSQAAQAVVTLSVPSQYAIGQKIKFSVPDSFFGMTELDGLEATVVAVNNAVGTQTVTVNLDTTGFTAFTFPTDAQFDTRIFSKAMVYPVGMNMAQALSSAVDPLSDAVTNTGFVGVELVAGSSSPAGEDEEVIYWQAYKVDRLDNE